MKLLDAAQARELDRIASSELGIPTLLLMENAALGACGILADEFPDAHEIFILCGPGQNGGDGLAMARHLSVEGRSVTILQFPGREPSGDAATNLAICRAMGLPIESIDDELPLRLATADLIVDALFGTGLDRPLEGMAVSAVSAINAADAPVLAIDVPSGVSASRGGLEGPAVQAAVTVTFAAPRIAHLVEPAASLCGDVYVVGLSIPDHVLERFEAPLAIGPEVVSRLFSERAPNTHKGTWGHVGIIAGSAGKSGAAILAARGAIRSGAGLVTVFTDSDTARLVDVASIESMTRAIDWDAPAETILDAVRSRDTLLIGSGLPDDEESWVRIRRIISRIQTPLVIDAGGINAHAARPRDLRSRRETTVLTPHPGELARLLEISIEEIAKDRIGAARHAAAETECTTILKGSGTIVAAPDGRCAVNTTGTPAMGSGGTGDVLAGVVAALLARGSDPFDAACAAVWTHGRAGEIAAGEPADIGLTASELADAIPLAIHSARLDEGD